MPLIQYLIYVRGDVHTNTIEGFFSRVKRGLNGTYHAVSREHLHRYMAQFEFAYNTRSINDGERVLSLLSKSEGKITVSGLLEGLYLTLG